MARITPAVLVVGGHQEIRIDVYCDANGSQPELVRTAISQLNTVEADGSLSSAGNLDASR
jgi:hypothetical protein